MLSETEPIIIKFFGCFSIRQGAKIVSESDNRSKKLWKLLQYIVANRDRKIPQEELIDLLWKDRKAGENPMSSLKTLLHRVRNMLDLLEFPESRHMILRQGGCYFWNPHLPVRIDTDDFSIMAEGTKLIDIPEDKLNSALRTMAIYKGSYLGGQYEGEAWADEPAKRYAEQYLYCYNTSVQILAGEERYDEIIFLSRHALEIDPSQELYYYNLISALIAKGAGEEALTAYREVLDLFYHTYRKTPSDRLRALYRGIEKRENNVETDIGIVREQMEKESTDGPVRCAYDTFRLIYEQKRLYPSAERKSYLLLFTVTAPDRKDLVPDNKQLDRALQQIETRLRTDFAKGDIYTRYSLTQILAIVTAPGEEILLDRTKAMRKALRTNIAFDEVDVKIKATSI